MPSSLSKFRKDAYRNQNGRCYYCGAHMWLKDSHDAYVEKYNLSKAQSLRFQCTAEHLIARQDDGKDSQKNIVAACLFCNTRRHKRVRSLSPEQYRELVQQRIAKGKWHPAEFRKVFNIAGRGSRN